MIIKDYMKLLVLKTFKQNITRKIITVSAICLLYCCGIFTRLFEKSFKNDFAPSNTQVFDNIKEMRVENIFNKFPPKKFSNYQLVYNPKKKCISPDTKIRLVYLVKSAIDHFQRRMAIRNSWGFENRFSDVGIRTVFILGVGSNDRVQSTIDEEFSVYDDIVQAEFTDSYYNNTIKTMIALKWAYENCNNAKFYFFSDDDYYVSTKNVLKFLRNPLEYPAYLEIPVASLKNLKTEIKRSADQKWTRSLKQVIDIELPEDALLFAGYVFGSSRPQRHMWSKWYVTLSEYPYDRWPPYVTAGSYVLSNLAMKQFHLAGHYVEPFRFDDIYLGFLAKLLDIVPVHCDEFNFYKKEYNGNNYKYVVSSHGFSDTAELINFWHYQKSKGNA